MEPDQTQTQTVPKTLRPDKNDLMRLIGVIKRNLLYGEDKVKELEKMIRGCRGDLNKDKLLLRYATDSPFVSPDVVRTFIDLGSNINDQDEQGRTILNWTVILDVGSIEDEDDLITDDASKLELINFLVEKGADVTLTDDDGNDPLKLALISGQPEFITSRFIDIIKHDHYPKPLTKVASPSQVVNKENKAGFTSLHLMLLTEVNANVTLLKAMVEVGADANLTDDENKNNALHWLFHSYPYPANNSKYTQEARGQVNERYNFQKYPILFYSAAGPKACFDLLMSLDVDINAINDNGKVPFELALSSPGPLNLEILSKLIPTKPEIVDTINSRENGSLSILKMLLKKDMRSIEDEHFENFLNQLLSCGCKINQLGLLCDAIHNFKFKYEMIKILISRGVSITVQDIRESIEMRRIDVAHLLLSTIYEQNDADKIQEIKDTYPDILCQAIGPFEWGAFDEPLKCSTLDIVKLLVEKYEIDINYSDKQCFVLHNLIRESPTGAMSIFEYLFSTYPDLDINKRVPMRSIIVAPWSSESEDSDHEQGAAAAISSPSKKKTEDCGGSPIKPKILDSGIVFADDPSCDAIDGTLEPSIKVQTNQQVMKKLIEGCDEPLGQVPSCSRDVSKEDVEPVNAGEAREKEMEKMLKDELTELMESRTKLKQMIKDMRNVEQTVYCTEDAYPGVKEDRDKSEPKYKMMSALELALKNDRWEFASLLLRRFASTKNLDPPTPTITGFTECYQLLYQLGVEVKLDGALHSRLVQKELDWFQEWMDKQKMDVKPLTKLASLVIRRNVASKAEMDEIFNGCLLPENVMKMLFLNDPQESYVPDNDPTDRWFAESDDDDDDGDYDTDYEDYDSNYDYDPEDDYYDHGNHFWAEDYYPDYDDYDEGDADDDDVEVNAEDDDDDDNDGWGDGVGVYYGVDLHVGGDDDGEAGHANNPGNEGNDGGDDGDLPDPWDPWGDGDSEDGVVGQLEADRVCEPVIQDDHDDGNEMDEDHWLDQEDDFFENDAIDDWD